MSGIDSINLGTISSPLTTKLDALPVPTTIELSPIATLTGRSARTDTRSECNRRDLSRPTTRSPSALSMVNASTKESMKIPDWLVTFSWTCSSSENAIMPAGNRESKLSVPSPYRSAVAASSRPCAPPATRGIAIDLPSPMEMGEPNSASVNWSGVTCNSINGGSGGSLGNSTISSFTPEALLKRLWRTLPTDSWKKTNVEGAANLIRAILANNPPDCAGSHLPCPPISSHSLHRSSDTSGLKNKRTDSTPEPVGTTVNSETSSELPRANLAGQNICRSSDNCRSALIVAEANSKRKRRGTVCSHAKMGNPMKTARTSPSAIQADRRGRFRFERREFAVNRNPRAIARSVRLAA